MFYSRLYNIKKLRAEGILSSFKHSIEKENITTERAKLCALSIRSLCRVLGDIRKNGCLRHVPSKMSFAAELSSPSIDG